jgi:long-chain acyl-CoA synthetase
MMYEQKPWLKFYGNIPVTIAYPKVTMYEAVLQTVQEHPDDIAYDFLGYTATYKTFAQQIDRCADALAGLGLKKGDRITISMPTSPQGIICFYAVNKLGAVSSMIHPLSTPEEIRMYLNISKSKFALTMDLFYAKFKEIKGRTQLQKIILTGITDYLGILKKAAFYLVEGRKIPAIHDPDVVWWNKLMKASYPRAGKADMKPDDMAAILYSGGTTGVPKGIMLSNMNFISEGKQVTEWARLSGGDSVLAILPIFHGFGLGVCVNAAFMGGGKSVLVPQFTPKTVAKMIKSVRPNFLVGVPTLFDALSRDPLFRKTDLSCLKATFSGADSLTSKVKKSFEETVSNGGGDVKLMQGYGLTEAVTAIMAMPLTEYREGSIGIPFPDMLAKIVKLGTMEEAPLGEEGEICVSGPAVMLGYIDQPEETGNTLKKHGDGRVWLHTGDIGVMDKDGFFYFKLRQKRMIKSSGMNVYPHQVEDVIAGHPDVKEACVIGVPDEAQVQRVKGFVVLKDRSKASPEKEKEIIEHCRKHLIKWSCPREIEFRDDLPHTLVGKVAFNVLEKEELARLGKQ